MARLSAEQKFIEEYLLDRDPFEAARRAGVAKVSIKATVKKWMANADIRAEIERRTLDMKAEDMIKPQWVISKFQEIASSRYASASEKNTALRELAKLAKMYPDQMKKGDDDDEGKRSNVLMVPGDASLDNWEAAAMKQQRALKDDVRN